MSKFSKIGVAIDAMEERIEANKLLMVSDPWQGKDAKPEAVLRRAAKSEESFEFFDKTYFTTDAYSDGYSEPCVFHKFLQHLWAAPGVHFPLGPRKHGKTATMKKSFAWLIVTGKVKFAATGSATLATSRNILSDIVDIITSERIKRDFGIEVIEDNADQFTFKRAGKKGIRRIIAISEKRSARGATMGFTRPEIALFDDLETRQSPMSEDSVRARIKIVQETFQSLSSKGVVVVLGNNFDERSAYNTLKEEQKQGILPKSWNVYSIPAWSEKKYSITAGDKSYKFPKGSLWSSRFPARTETELRDMLSVADESEWQGDFQQNPVPPDGFLFNRRFDIEYADEELPADARGVIYTDPNLAKKGKGDATCIMKLLYSPEKDLYYIPALYLQSFSASDDLLTKTLLLKDNRVKAVGMDGNVGQESVWSNNVKLYSRIHKIAYSPVQYCHYRVDELTKNAQLLWEAGKIKIARSVIESKEGIKFLEQLYAFSGKKAKRPDDGPDAFICSVELIHERRLVRRKAVRRQVSVITETMF